MHLCTHVGMDGRTPLTGRTPPAAASDIYRFSPATGAWTTLAYSGTAPPARRMMGFTATPGGMLYVFGGRTDTGKGARFGKGPEL